MTGIDGDERRSLSITEPRTIVVINNAATAERHDAVMLGDRQRQMLPVREIPAHGVPPAHVPPRNPRRIVLIEQMVFAVVIDKSVGIVHPMDLRTEMILRPVWLIHVLGGLAIPCLLVFEIETGWRRVGLNDVIDADMAPAPCRFVKDAQPRLLSGQLAHVPGRPQQIFRVSAARAPNRLVVKQQLDADGV